MPRTTFIPASELRILGGSDRGYNWKIITILGFLLISYVLITLVNRVFLHLCGKISPKIFEVDRFNRQKSRKSRFLAKMTLSRYIRDRKIDKLKILQIF